MAEPQGDWFQREELIGHISDMRVQNLQVERERTQKRTFTRWINFHLERCSPPLEVTDLFADVQDGRVLMALLEVLSGCSLTHEYRRSSHRIFRLNNIARALSFLEEGYVKLVSIDAAEIANGNPAMILGLIWNIILYFQIKEATVHLKIFSSSCSSLSSAHSGSDPDLAAHSPTPRDKAPPTPFREQRKTIKALLKFVQRRTRKYGVAVQDFGRSWRSGLAFLALIKTIEPGLVDMRRALERSSRDNIQEAFRVAHLSLGIRPLLEPEDVMVDSPEEQSIMTYVSQFLEHFPEVDEEDVLEDSSEAQLRTTQMNVADLLSPPLPQASLPQAPLPQALLPQALLPQALLPQAPLPQAPLPQAPLPQAPLPQVLLPQAPLPQATLPQATLPQAPLGQRDAVTNTSSGPTSPEVQARSALEARELPSQPGPGFSSDHLDFPLWGQEIQPAVAQDCSLAGQESVSNRTEVSPRSSQSEPSVAECDLSLEDLSDQSDSLIESVEEIYVVLRPERSESRKLKLGISSSEDLSSPPSPGPPAPKLAKHAELHPSLPECWPGSCSDDETLEGPSPQPQTQNLSFRWRDPINSQTAGDPGRMLSVESGETEERPGSSSQGGVSQDVIVKGSKDPSNRPFTMTGRESPPWNDESLDNETQVDDEDVSRRLQLYYPHYQVSERLETLSGQEEKEEDDEEERVTLYYSHMEKDSSPLTDEAYQSCSELSGTLSAPELSPTRSDNALGTPESEQGLTLGNTGQLAHSEPHGCPPPPTGGSTPPPSATTTWVSSAPPVRGSSPPPIKTSSPPPIKTSTPPPSPPPIKTYSPPPIKTSSLSPSLPPARISSIPPKGGFSPSKLEVSGVAPAPAASGQRIEMELEAGMAVPKYEDLQILEPEEEAGNSDNSEEVEEEICDVLERGAGETWDEEGGGHARQLDNTADTCNRDRHTVPGVQGSAPESSSNSTRTTIAREMEPSLHQAPPSPEPIVVTKAVHSAVWLENSTTREGLRKRTSDGSGTRLEEEGLQEAVPLSSLAQRVEDPASGPQRPPGPPYLFILIWMAIYCLIVLLHLDMDSLMQSVWS